MELNKSLHQNIRLVDGPSFSEINLFASTETKSVTIISVLLEDHAYLRRLGRQLSDPRVSFQNRKKMYEYFQSGFLAHAYAEEQILYSKVRHIEEPRRPIEESFEEHALCHYLIDKIYESEQEDSWTARVNLLCDLMIRHFRDEETELFVKVQHLFDSIELDTMASRYFKAIDSAYGSSKLALPTKSGFEEWNAFREKEVESWSSQVLPSLYKDRAEYRSSLSQQIFSNIRSARQFLFKKIILRKHCV